MKEGIVAVRRGGFGVLRILGLVLVATIVIGCGRQGAPRPPEYFAPRPVGMFSLQGTVEGVRLQWQAPQLQANGETLLDLDRFRIYRADFVERGRPDFDPLADIPYDGPRPDDEEDKEDKENDKALEGLQQRRAPKQEAVFVEYLDTSPEPGRRYLYYVIPYGRSRTPGDASQTLMVTYIGEASQVELYVVGQ